MFSIPSATEAHLILENGKKFKGKIFGAVKSVSGEVVFNTGMVGYPETLTDPSYKGQILVSTYPMMGNYGVPSFYEANTLKEHFESDKIQVNAYVVSEISELFHHWNGAQNLDSWFKNSGVTGLAGIDTRTLTKILRESGTMLGRIVVGNSTVKLYDPAKHDLIQEVTTTKVQNFGKGKKKILLIDCGCKNRIIHHLLRNDYSIKLVPYNHDISKEEFDGLVISNGPGNPEMYPQLIENVKKIFSKNKPMLGICMGHQIISMAAGAKTYKLKYGHRSQNQPVIDELTKKCFITSQNHGYAMDTKSLPDDWEPWFTNLNDGTNEGIIHKKKPFMSVQFHPEAAPGPVDTAFIFDKFLRVLK